MLSHTIKGSGGISPWLMPLWTFSYSNLVAHSHSFDEQQSNKFLFSIGVTLVIANGFILTPDITLGEHLWDPGISFVISNSALIRAEVANLNNKTIPTFTIGWIY